MASAGQLLSRSEASGAGANDCDAFFRFVWRYLRLYPTHLPALVNNRAFNRFDSDWLIGQIQRTGRLTRGRTNSAGEFGKVIRAMEDFDGFAPVALVNQIVPVRNDVVDRASVMAIRDTTIHATRPLFLEFVFGQGNNEFLVILDPVSDQAIASILTRNFHETGRFAHLLLTSMRCLKAPLLIVSRSPWEAPLPPTQSRLG